MTQFQPLWFLYCLLLFLFNNGQADAPTSLPVIDEIFTANGSEALYEQFETIAYTQHLYGLLDGGGGTYDDVTTITRARQTDGTWVMVAQGQDTTTVTTEDYELQRSSDGSLKKSIPITESARERWLTSKLYGDILLVRYKELDEELGVTQDGDRLTIVISAAIPLEYSYFFGLEAGKLQSECDVDAETLLLRQGRVYHIAEDGTKTLLQEASVATNVPFELPAFYVDAASAMTRTLHLVVEPDTEGEETLTLTAPRYAYIGILADGPFGLFTDRECMYHHVATETDAIPEEMTLYLQYEE